MERVQLITYPDSLGGDLSALEELLEGPFAGLFPGGVHILPPYPSTADRGFAPVTYQEIDPAFGSWENIGRIAGKRPVLLDLMVNHVSRHSGYFRDFLHRGQESPYADMFITLDKIWQDGTPREEDIARIFLRRERPYSEYERETGPGTVTVWTTFGKTDPSEQVDIDVWSEPAKEFIAGVFAAFADRGVRLVRLDAVAYVTKRAGTSCFFLEPEIYDFMSWISGVAGHLGIELLPEIHADYTTQKKLVEHGYWIYDFILPYMIVEALIAGECGRLGDYIATRPHRQFTMIDCHDGLPVKPDLDGLVSSDDARRVVNVSLERGGQVSRVYSEHHKSPDGFDVHQISGTLFSLLGEDDDALVVARAIQLFVPGVPQVYYVGLLAGANDQAAFEATGDRRALNRHNYSYAEIEAALRRPVVRRILRLIRLRNDHPAFAGEFALELETRPGADPGDKPPEAGAAAGKGYESTTARPRNPRQVSLSWRAGEQFCRLSVDVSAKTGEVEYTERKEVCHRPV
jgi:sucrose phosphorylase